MNDLNSKTEPVAPGSIVVLEAGDGTPYRCQFLDLFEFERRSYALLLKKAQAGADESLVVMQVIGRDGQSVFRSIADDGEFARVIRHVENRAERAAEAEMREDEE